MKWIMLSFTVLLAPSLAQGQSIALEVVGTAGDYYQFANHGNLHWTIGEIATETFANGETVTQGFQQGLYSVTTALPKASFDLALKIYPNPTTDWAILETTAMKPLRFTMTDLHGKLLTSKMTQGAQTKLDVGNLTPGTYFISVFDEQRHVQTFKLQKTNF